VLFTLLYKVEYRPGADDTSSLRSFALGSGIAVLSTVRHVFTVS